MSDVISKDAFEEFQQLESCDEGERGSTNENSQVSMDAFIAIYYEGFPFSLLSRIVGLD